VSNDVATEIPLVVRETRTSTTAEEVMDDTIFIFSNCFKLG